MSIVPIKGYHENPRSLLAEIMEDDDIGHLVVITVDKAGNTKSAHWHMTREEMAYAALLIQQMAMSE